VAILLLSLCPYTPDTEWPCSNPTCRSARSSPPILKAKALENDVRAKILDMLADEEMTIEGIHKELQRRGGTRPRRRFATM